MAGSVAQGVGAPAKQAQGPKFHPYYCPLKKDCRQQ
jgi:hypothetical protein